MSGLLQSKWRGLLDYVQANTPRNTRPAVKPSDVINQGLLNPNEYNAPAANRFKDSAFGLLGIVPGVGDAASAAESADLFNRGENFAGGMAALGALPLVPAIGGMIKTPFGRIPETTKETEKLRDLIFESAKKKGYDVSFGDSNVSPSRYVSASPDGMINDYDVRFSNHGDVNNHSGFSVDPKTGNTFEESLLWLKANGVELDDLLKKYPTTPDRLIERGWLEK